MPDQQPSETATFGDALRRARRSRGLTQEALAERAGVSVRAISDLERGARAHPYRETATRLADALELTGHERAGWLTLLRRPAPTEASGAVALQPSPLPAPLTRLIGRDEACRDIARLLRDDRIRLLTLTGPAGVGKTSLAATVAASLGDAFRDGVVVVDLAPLQEPALVVPAVAAALQITDQGSISLTEAVRRRLRARQMLLVLDNFEHLLPAAPGLSDLLQAAPGVQALVTSRAALRLRGERTFPVVPLPTPDFDAGLARDDWDAWPAIALFVERAQAAEAGFRLTAENAAAIAGICRRLDGLPLAIELAAARVKLLPPDTLLQRLEHRLSLLTSGPRDAPARQRTLRAAIAWSYDALHPEQQALLRHLAIFADGWTLEAAEFVGAANDAPDALDALDALVAHSLVLRDDRGTGPRYRLLETIREFAIEQLAVHEEMASARGAFLHYLVQLARENDLAQLDAEAGVRLDRLIAEATNVLMGLEWAIEHEPEAALHILAELGWFWFHTDQPGTGRRFCERVLATEAGMRSPARVRVMQQAAWLASAVGDFAALQPLVDAARNLAEPLGDARTLAYVRMHEGDLAMSRGDTAQARTLLDAALAQFEAMDDQWGVMITLTVLGIAALDQGEPAAAVVYFTRIAAMTSERQLPPYYRAHVLANLAFAYRQLGREAEAFAAAREALQLARGAGRISTVAAAQGELARLFLDRGEVAQAVPLVRECLVAQWEIGNTWDLTPTLELTAMVLAAGEGFALATQLLAAAAGLREAMPYPVGAGEQPALERCLAAIRASLGEEQFSCAWTNGRTAPLESTVRAATTGLAALVG